MKDIREANTRVKQMYGEALVIIDKEWRPKADNTFLCMCCGTQFKALFSRVMEGRGCPSCQYTPREYAEYLQAARTFEKVGFRTYPLMYRNRELQCVKCNGVISAKYTPNLTGCPYCANTEQEVKAINQVAKSQFMAMLQINKFEVYEFDTNEVLYYIGRKAGGRMSVQDLFTKSERTDFADWCPKPKNVKGILVSDTKACTLALKHLNDIKKRVQFTTRYMSLDFPTLNGHVPEFRLEDGTYVDYIYKEDDNRKKLARTYQDAYKQRGDINYVYYYIDKYKVSKSKNVEYK